MATNARPLSKSAGAGCLIVFALPFAAAGVGMLVWLASTLLTCLSARNWVETPARIVRAELKVNHGRKSTTYQVTAAYTYDFGGQHYNGSRVGLTGGSDNIGSFQQNAYHELIQYQRSGKPFRCYVNPAAPGEALLYRDLRWEMVALQMFFVLVFGGVGFGLLAGGVATYRQQRARAALAAAHPDKPWMWKADWAAGRIVTSNKTTMWATLAFAFFWNLVSAPVWFILPGEIFRKGNLWALLFMLFPVIGLALAGGAVYCVLRWLKFGQSEFQMADVPGRIGGQLAGVVRTFAKVRPEDGFHVALRCVRQIITGSGKARSTTERVLWEDQQTVMHELLDDQAEISAIPVVFQIPADCRPSDDRDARDRTLWRLVTSAKVPGIDYSATFEVPVFATTQSEATIAPDNSGTTG